MPALLSNGGQHYNRAKRIQPNDPVGQLSYYLDSSSAASSSGNSFEPAVHHQLRARFRHQHKSSISASAAEVSPESAFYTSHLSRAITRQQQQHTPSYLQQVNAINSIAKHRKLHDKPLDSPASNSSGFSDGTREEPVKTQHFGAQSFHVQLGEAAATFGRKLSNHAVQWRSSPSASPPTKNLKSRQVNVCDGAVGGFNNDHSGQMAGNRQRKNGVSSRLKRRNIRRFNRRMVLSEDQELQLMSNPYSFRELFSQSEIPGFREIFASDSYLRKFCWIVVFLIFSVISLRDVTVLYTEYLDAPVTVDVRLRDSARLPFPAVTVCNLNVVRYTALCRGSSIERFNLTDKIPIELREKLCGFQVEKKNTTDETDIGDINNIGTTTTTTTTTSTTTTTTTTAAPPSSTASGAVATSSVANEAASVTDHSGGHLGGSNNNHNAIEHKASPSASNGSGTTRSPGASNIPDEFSDSSSLLMSSFSRRRLQRRSIRVSSESDRSYGGVGTGFGSRPFASTSSQVRVWRGTAEPQETGRVQVPKRLPAANALNNVRVNLPSNLDRPSHGLPVNPISNPKHAFLNPTTTTPATTSTAAFVPTALPEDFELTERQERELQESLTNWLAVMYNHDPTMTGLLGHQFDDMLLRCTMKSVNCTHRRSFDTSFTPTEGNCFTYRSKLRRRTTGGAKAGQVQQPPYQEANLASTSHGLELVLNLEKGEYISGSSQVGALVMIHHPSELGYTASEATFVPPEYTTYIGVKMVNLTRLPYPHPENCVDSWPTKSAERLTRNSTYSQQACIRICLQRTIQNQCNCQSASLPIVELQDSPQSSTNNNQQQTLQQSTSLINQQQQSMNGSAGATTDETNGQRIIICDTRKAAIKHCVHEVMLRPADRVQDCECPPKCQVVRYDKTISIAKWPTREDRVTFDRGKTDLNFQNLAKVIVYFQTMTCDEITQQPLYNLSKIVSALGGIMGMYVGFSFLSVFEILEVMSRKMWHHFKGRLFRDNLIS